MSCIYWMEAIYILVRINGGEDVLSVQMVRERELYQDAVDLRQQRREALKLSL